MRYTLELDEGQRQLVLLALAVLSLESPGFDYALNEVAVKIDNVEKDRALMYDQFRAFRKNHEARTCNHPIHKLAGDDEDLADLLKTVGK